VLIEMRSLRCGDYALPNGVLVERKAVPDLHDALVRGRFWPQIGRLRDACSAPYVVVEGSSIDRGPLSPDAVRGACLAVAGQGIVLVQTQGPRDTACWLHLLALRRAGLRPSRDRPAYAQRIKPPADLVREALLAAIPGLSVASSRSLLERFGTVAAIIGADPKAWLEVPGIGRSRAEALRRAFFT
jgi:ERCC4-type nuclease